MLNSFGEEGCAALGLGLTHRLLRRRAASRVRRSSAAGPQSGFCLPQPCGPAYGGALEQSGWRSFVRSKPTLGGLSDEPNASSVSRSERCIEAPGFEARTFHCVLSASPRSIARSVATRRSPRRAQRSGAAARRSRLREALTSDLHNRSAPSRFSRSSNRPRVLGNPEST